MFTAVLCLALTAPAAQPKSILDELTAEGLDIPGVGKHKLPTPALKLGMSEADTKAEVQKFVADRREFLDKNRNAPFRLDRVGDVVDRSGKVHGREFHLYFAAHGNIKDLDEHGLVHSLLGMKAGPRKAKGSKDLDYLDDDDLKARGLVPATIQDGEERYSLLDMELFDKVKVDGVMRSRKQWVNGSLVTTMVLDPRFLNDKKYPNRWRSIPERKDDKDTLGPPQPYGGFGGYVKATPVPGMKNVIFLEMHFALSEPHDWFGGRNLIAARLPMATKENVANLRKKLADKSR
ncbi:MAG: hypothetical protein U0797_18710 [Gemmataceae bacterium]